MTDVDKDSIRAWYEANGMEYKAEDWGARSETGESATLQTAEPDRLGRAWVQTQDPSVLGGLEGDEGGTLRPAWVPRDPVDRAMVEAIEDFFRTYSPEYFTSLPALAALLYEPEASLSELADDQGVSKQAVSQARQRAVARVERNISRYWSDPEGTSPQRAWAVFVDFWRQRFGTDFPEVNGAAGTEWVGQTA